MGQEFTMLGWICLGTSFCIATEAHFIFVVQKCRIPMANWYGRLVNLSVGKLRVIVQFATMKGLSIIGIIGLRQMNRTSDFWVAIQWMYFKRIQQCSLIIAPQVRIILFFEAWWLQKKYHFAFSSLSTVKKFHSVLAKVISADYWYAFYKLEN